MTGTLVGKKLSEAEKMYPGKKVMIGRKFLKIILYSRKRFRNLLLLVVVGMLLACCFPGVEGAIFVASHFQPWPAEKKAQFPPEKNSQICAKEWRETAGCSCVPPN